MSHYDNASHGENVAAMNADNTPNITAKQDAELLGTVYQAVSMGAGATEHLMKVAKDKHLRDEFTKEMKDYLAVEAAALGRLHRLHETPETVGTMTRMMSNAGIKLNTALDSSPSRLASIASQNAGTALTEMRGALNANPYASDEAKHIAEAYIKLEEKNMSALSDYLS